MILRIWRATGECQMKSLPLLSMILGAVLYAGAAGAKDGLGAPTGPVMLTVSGNIATTNVDGQARFDRTMLHALQPAMVRTATPWTDGHPIFTGILMRDILSAVGSMGVSVTAIALDDYSFTIPVADFERYPVLLAMEMNGEPMSSDKGPMWIVYPRDDFPELDQEETDYRMVWQVRELVIE